MSDVHDNAAESRFEWTVDGEIAIARYETRPGAIAFTHTFVPERLRGRGIATRLVETALASARERGLLVTPACAMFAAYIEAHPETHDLLDPASRR